MSSPFPGMNPYLENQQLWTEVHHRLITAIADDIAPAIRPKYRVAIEKRIYLCESQISELVGIPDVAIVTQKSLKKDTTSVATLSVPNEAIEITLPIPEEAREAYLEIREVATGYVVTTIEILSSTNKRIGIGREKYEQKRREILSSPCNLVEIDLLRSGQSMPIVEEIPETDYRILISSQIHRPHAILYAFSVRQPIPSFSIPLHKKDSEPVLNLQNLLLQVYDRAGFDLAIDYNLEPIPKLKEEDRLWADNLLREKGLRQ